MEPRGRERHRWATERSKWAGAHESKRGQQTSFNGASGMSDIEGKAARVAASECGQRGSFKSLLILTRSGDMENMRSNFIQTMAQLRAKLAVASRD